MPCTIILTPSRVARMMRSLTRTQATVNDNSTYIISVRVIVTLGIGFRVRG